MQLQIGDRLIDETGGWEVISRPYTTAGGKDARVRVHRVDRKPGDTGYGGRPDGASVDAQGNYWCAMFEGQKLLKISPAGHVLQEVPLPVRCPTMPCFGGPDGKTLFVTTASHTRSADELAAFPQSGHVIATEVDVPGLRVNFVNL